MFREIWSMTEKPFLPFWTFFPFLVPYGLKFENQNFQKNEKNTSRYYHFTKIDGSHMMYGSTDMKCNGQNFCHFGLFFALLPSNNLKIQNFEKMKELFGDIIILRRCNINENHDT